MLFEGAQLLVFCHSSNRGLTHSYAHPVINTGVFLGEHQYQGFTETPDSRLAVQSRLWLCTQASCSRLELSRVGGVGGLGCRPG